MNLLINTDAKRIPLADNSVNCVVTSPPYYGQRDYKVDGQIGLEITPQEYVESMCLVADEIWRVLKDDGVFWLNIGDSWASNHTPGTSDWKTGWKHGDLSKGYQARAGGAGNGIKPKDLIGIPWMIAFAFRDRGWYLRSENIWAKKNCMPESVKDRTTSSHEQVFMFTKQDRYWYDHEAVKTPTKGGEHDKRARVARKRFPTERVNGIRKTGYYPMANLRDVWHIATVPYHGNHYASFPPKLIEPCILAGCPEGGLVLDPFVGSGVTCMVARKHRRNAIGLDLNFEYLTTNARERLQYGSFVPVADGVTQLTIEGS